MGWLDDVSGLAVGRLGGAAGGAAAGLMAAGVPDLLDRRMPRRRDPAGSDDSQTS